MTSPLDTLTLRRAVPDAVTGVAKLVAVTIAFSNAYEYAPAGRALIARLYMADTLARQAARGRIHLARDAKGAAGFVALSPARHGLSVDALFVHPDTQGRGVGRALLEHGLAEAARRSGHGVERVTVLSSLTAEGFYARLGFERLREVPRDYGLAILMSRS